MNEVENKRELFDLLGTSITRVLEQDEFYVVLRNLPEHNNFTYTVSKYGDGLRIGVIFSDKCWSLFSAESVSPSLTGLKQDLLDQLRAFHKQVSDRAALILELYSVIKKDK